MLVGWIIAAVLFVAGFQLTGIWLAIIFTALFLLQYLSVSLYRYSQIKQALDLEGQKEDTNNSHTPDIPA